MPELIAQGKNLDHRWRRMLPGEGSILLGRNTPSFRVPWDDRISREHVKMTLDGNLLLVEKLSNAANPVFFNGREATRFELQAGEHFAIGSTTFTLTREAAHVSLDHPNPIHQKTFSSEFLRNVRFRNAEQRIEVLNRLPDIISSAAVNEQDLLNRICTTLLSGITTASTVGFVRCNLKIKNDAAEKGKLSKQERNEDSGTIDVLHWDRRGSQTGDFCPSESLIRQAITNEETILHQWKSGDRHKVEFTVDLENDWAFVCSIHGDATPGWGIYITGSQRTGPLHSPRDSDVDDLQGDIKFCQLVGSVLMNLMQVRQLERRQASLRNFFSPIVMETMAGQDPDVVLAPKECLVSVMFCDLRGFSRTSEDMEKELFQLLGRVSSSLDVMTGEILKHGGVIGDFHGDAAMGFWGWPLFQPDTAKRAVHAGLAIQAGFRKIESRDLGFQVAIGIASGPAVAGKIGSQDQAKVTAFGPVVNLAARLEGLNRTLNSSMLMDRATLDQILNYQATISPEKSIPFRWRSMGLFQPFGMNASIEVIEVLSNDDELSDEQLAVFSAALDYFRAGEWKACRQRLLDIRSTDHGRQFLLDYMQNCGDQRPANWQGIVQLRSK